MFTRLNSLMLVQPWFIIPAEYDGLVTLYSRFVNERQSGEVFKEDWLDQFLPPPLAKQGLDKNNIGHLVVDGVLAPRLSMIDQKCGGVDSAKLPGDMASLVKDGAKGMMFHINSPGGSGAMIPELAKAVEDLSKQIPTASYAYGVEASAATWAFAGVGLKGATPSAVMGSIGGFIPFMDKEQLLANIGLKFAPVVSSGADLKLALGGPSLSVSERQYLQDGLNASVQQFQNHVVRNRESNGKTMVDMQTLSRGGAYKADKAAQMGLVDAVGDYSHIYDTLLSRVSKKS